jgi:hypothetical protein
LGDDVTVNYEILPADIAFDKVELQVRNSRGELVYKRDDLAATGGKVQTTKWEKVKWSEPPFVGAYANPANNDYAITVVGYFNDNGCPAEPLKINTKFILSAEIKDIKSGSASRASGLSDLDKTLKIRFQSLLGSMEFQASDIEITEMKGLEKGSYGKMIKLDKPALNQLQDGEWTIQIKDIRDAAGNFVDANPATPEIEPYEKKITLN